MKFKTIIENQEKVKKSIELGNELDGLLLKTVTKIIEDFMKKKVYQPNLKADMEDVIHSDIVLAKAFQGLYNLSKGGYEASKKSLPKGIKL
jgi:hypothetical protein